MVIDKCGDGYGCKITAKTQSGCNGFAAAKENELQTIADDIDQFVCHGL